MSRYNANVRVGNWYNDLILQEEKTKQYVRKNATAELKVQKTRLTFLQQLKEVPLTFPVSGLSFGAVVQIVSPEMPDATHFQIKERQGIALGANIYYPEMDERLDFAPGDAVIGTGLLTPCIRNVWTLVPEDPALEGKPLRFGDVFRIRLYGNKEPLYVEAPVNRPGIPTGECRKITPTLSADKSVLTRFQAVHINRRLRYETEGSLVPAFEKIAIIQCCNRESLAVEPDTWFPTYFGMECEVSMHTYMTIRTKPDPRNFWSFILSS